LGIKVYMAYCYTILGKELQQMKRHKNTDEIRWQVVKAMLEEFPSLRTKVKEYLKSEEKKEKAYSTQILALIPKDKSEK
jgi:hypothetical protein